MRRQSLKEMHGSCLFTGIGVCDTGVGGRYDKRLLDRHMGMETMEAYGSSAGR